MAIGEVCSICEQWVYEFDVNDDDEVICVGCRDFNEKYWEDSNTDDEIEDMLNKIHGNCRGKN